MEFTLDDKLVIGITTRALFDLSEASGVFDSRGLTAFREYQHAHELDPLGPGTAFPLIKGLLAINGRATHKLIEVVVVSRNHAEAGLRVFNSIEHHHLAIERGIFRGGREPWPYLSALNCSLFLSAEREAVIEALRSKVPAALVLTPPHIAATAEPTEVRIAFDGDAVLFGDESDRLFQRSGLVAFQEHEAAHADEPLSPGPFEPFLRALKKVQDEFDEGDSPIRIALVTARNAPAHKRMINTLRAWGVRIDEMFILGGIEKAAVLRVFQPDIFFDDQITNLAPASRDVPSAQVIAEVDQLAAFDDIPTLSTPLAPLAELPSVAGPQNGKLDAGEAPVTPESARDEEPPAVPEADE